MKKYFYFTKKTFLTFFSLGILVFILDMVFNYYWLDAIRFIINEPNLSWDLQPNILKVVNAILTYSPWLILLLILIRDISRKNFSRSSSFFAGLALTYFTLLYYILSTWVDIG